MSRTAAVDGTDAARAAIDTILQADSSGDAMEMGVALMSQEARQLTPYMRMHQLESGKYPKLGCFDTSHLSNSWTAQPIDTR